MDNATFEPDPFDDHHQSGDQIRFVKFSNPSEPSRASASSSSASASLAQSLSYFFNGHDRVRLLWRVLAILGALVLLTTIAVLVWNLHSTSDDHSQPQSSTLKSTGPSEYNRTSGSNHLDAQGESSSSITTTDSTKNVIATSSFPSSTTPPTAKFTTSTTAFDKTKLRTGSTTTSTTSTTTTTTTTESPTEAENRQRQDFVRQMAHDAWHAYVSNAWGDEALCPLTAGPYEGHFGNRSGLTVVAAMSTLAVMGLHEEYHQAEQWVRTELNLSRTVEGQVMVFDLMRSYVGGLLSAHALTGNEMLRAKAVEVARLTEAAFATISGIPYEDISPRTRLVSDNQPYLSYAGGMLLELNYLSAVTGNSTYRARANRIVRHLRAIEKPRGLYLKMINTMGNWVGNRMATLFTLGRQFYTSLLKSYVQSGGANAPLLDMYRAAMDAAEKSKLVDMSTSGHYYVRNLDTTPMRYEKHMEYAGCYLGAMLAMGADAMRRELSANHSIDANRKRAANFRVYRHWQLAEELTETCRQVSNQTATGLGPTQWYFTEGGKAELLFQSGATTDDPFSAESAFVVPDHAGAYGLSSELAESYFVLWRLTHDTRYREAAWALAQSIRTYCQIGHLGTGFSGILNVDSVEPEFSNYQSPHFLSATLKYLYLTFADDSVMPLDEWVFNSDGHPLPICGGRPVVNSGGGSSQQQSTAATSVSGHPVNPSGTSETVTGKSPILTSQITRNCTLYAEYKRKKAA